MKIICIILTLLSLNIYSQIDFNKHPVFEAGGGLREIITVDLNNDGYLDILTLSGFSTIVWYKNIDGRFSEKKLIPNSTSYNSHIDIADIDNDGDMDVFLLSNSKLSWFENLNGYFSAEKIITTDIFLVSKILFFDVDSDGDLDIVSKSKESGNINVNLIDWFENIDGFGNFEEKQIITSITGYNILVEIYGDDYDGDNDVDLMISKSETGNYDTGIVFWLENSNGDFNTQHDLQDFAIDRVQLTGDLNGDGAVDVIGISNNTKMWYENDGLGNFTTHSFTENFSTNTINLIDIDNDSDLDIVYSYENGTRIKWWNNSDGQGNFIMMQPIYDLSDSNIGTPDIILLSSGDIDNDNKIDIITSQSGRVSWLKNIDNTGNFSSDNLVFLFIKFLNTIEAVDIDGDGDNDIISEYTFNSDYVYNSSRLVLYKNIDGEGSLGEEIIIDKGNAFLNISSIKTGDIDNDGDLDIFISIGNFPNIGRLSWYENMDGQGTFSNKKIIDNNNVEGATSIFLSDIDNDGDLDLIASASSFHNDGEKKVVWYENLDGLGNFGNQQIILSGDDEINFVSVADIDGDNNLDIISGFSGNGLKWSKSNGNGTFNIPQVIGSIDYINYIDIDDIDNDNDLDIIITSLLTDKIIWYENMDGLGTFQIGQIITGIDGPTSVTTIDLDNDGDKDIVTSSKYDDNFSWYENTNGLGDFGLRVIIGYDNSASIVSGADMDGDGKTDIVCGGNSLGWYKNLGLVESNEINGVVHLDMDNNGCDNLDLSISNLLIVNNNGIENTAIFTQANGFFQFFVHEGVYTTNITPDLPAYFTMNPNFHTTNFASVGNTEVVNFCLEPNQTINNLNISILPVNQARPGFSSTYQIVYKNMGTTPLNGFITFDFDDTKLSFIESSETISSQTSNSLIFGYSTLNPFETRIITVKFNVLAPPINEIGDSLNFTATINPIVNDFIEEDNMFSFNQTIIGSYDPNNIVCLEGDKIQLEDIDKYLHYVIRFQNTGTANAINVVVKNILNPYLDWSTIQLESISHQNRVIIEKGNEVSFIFDNIDLPNINTDEPNSHGFIAYKIKLRNDISTGDVINNKADIFFDFNEAIETNITSTEIISSLDVIELQLVDFLVYPNPTENILNIKSKTEISKIEIYSKLGQLILLNENGNNINISSLTNGLYFVRVEDVYGNFGVKKIIKK